MHAFGRNCIYSRNVRKQEPTRKMRDLGKQLTGKQDALKRGRTIKGNSFCILGTDRQTEALCRALPRATPARLALPPMPIALSQAKALISPAVIHLQKTLAAPPQCLMPISHPRHPNFRNRCCFAIPCS